MPRQPFSVLLALLIALASLLPGRAEARGPLVLAAASLQEAMNDAADAWAAKGHDRPVISFAGSSSLARQIMAGAPADLFISADQGWMTHIEKAGFLRKGSRRDLLANRLALIAPKQSPVNVKIGPGFDLSGALGRKRLAMANPDAVPAGKYGKAALRRLGVWGKVRTKVASAENVRAAMALVERAAAPLGIVYATDAKASTRVRIVGIFPHASHPAIIYPVAVLKNSQHADAIGFWRFLQSRAARKLFARRGFTAP